MASVQNLILEPAYRKLRVRIPTANELTYALAALNALIGSHDLVVNAVTRESFVLTLNIGDYSIGASADFNTVRPSSIYDAYLREGTTDTKLDVNSLEDYNDIHVKTTVSRPSRLYYLKEYPLGRILFDYLPDKAYTLLLDSWKPLSSFPLVTTEVSLPPEYEEPLIFGLATRLSSEMNESMSQLDLALAERAKDRLERLNFIDPASSDFSHVPGRKRRYDGLTDQYI